MDWKPIETAPVGVLIDVWLWDVDETGPCGDGRRFADVRLRDDGDPTLIEIMTDVDEGWYDFYPHENGMWASHWQPSPPAPPLPSPPETAP